MAGQGYHASLKDEVPVCQVLPLQLHVSQAAESAAAYAQTSAAGAAGGAKASSASAEEDSGAKEFSTAFYRTRLISFAAMVVACAPFHSGRELQRTETPFGSLLRAAAWPGHVLFYSISNGRVLSELMSWSR